MSTQSAFTIVLWACLSSWYYGYHLSELNFPATSLTCLPSVGTPRTTFPDCLGLDAFRYSVVTAIFTVGGLIGSLVSSMLVHREGLKGGIVWTGWMNMVGVAMMAFAPRWTVLAVGRLIVGISSGVAICLVPPFLSLLARSTPSLAGKSGFIGTMNQMGIVAGLFSAQVVGLILTGSKGDALGKWRYVVTISGFVSIVQIVLAPQIPDPTATSYDPISSESAAEQGVGDRETSPTPAQRSLPASQDEASPLLSSGSASGSGNTQLSLRELLSNTSLRGPTILCASLLCLQQFSGVNAVMFYSTPVLRPLLPASAGVLGIGITLVNALMTLPAIFLVDRMGRRALLLISLAGMAVMSALLSIGLDNSFNILSGFAIVLFVASFAVGFGPIPFLLTSELVPPPAIPALSSLALSCNWISNFIVAILFLPLRDALSSPKDPRDPLSERIGEGRVFLVFTAVCLVTSGVVWRGLAGAPK